jgi:Flp pilus assembly protein TadG
MRGRALLFVRGFARDHAAATAAEFALVLPLLILFLFGIIDVGRFMWEWNKAEKATQMGVRFAVVTNIVPTGLADYDFTTISGVQQGAPINATLFPGVSCTGTAGSASCTCKASCAFPTTANATWFNNIVTRMRRIDSRITAPNVVIDYDPSGLGFAGNPYGADVAPIVTVRLQNMQFKPILSGIFGGSISMAGFDASLTMEDGAGTVSN